MTYELKHVSTGESLHYAYEYGWEILQDPYGGGHFDCRCTGGWWLFKGDESQARAEQNRRWAKVLKDMGVA